MMRSIVLIVTLVLGACAVPTAPPPERSIPPAGPAQSRAVADLVAVADRMDPVITRACRARNPGLNCDFMMLVDERPGRPPNAFQTLDRATGRPVIGFTRSLLDEMRNHDELALILGHEAAHHIARHLQQRERSARAGALVMGELVALGGADAASVRRARDLGADLGARVYSQEFELEADALGARLAHRAGFDPVRGMGFLQRMPEGHHHFLATHPPVARRVALVRDVAAELDGR